MSKSVSVDFNEGFFSAQLKSGVGVKMAASAANSALANAQATAHVGGPGDPHPGAYRDSLHVERHDTAYRAVYRVETSSDYALKLESLYGTLARALKGVKA